MICKYPKDLTGLKFGRLTVTKKSIKNNSHSYWICLCDCGNVKLISRPNLVSKGTKSCGCIKKEQNALGRKEYGYSNFKVTYNQYLNSAKRRGFTFNISETEAKLLMQQNCFYCNKPPSTIVKAKNRYGEFIRNGIDRINSNKNYTLDNVVTCCDMCNWMKLDHSKDEFLNHIKNIYKHRVKNV